jgi:uncharacterized protein (UPF0332 family)
MSFDWSNYLDLARELQRQGAIHSSKEAELRSSISRAYYSAFCKARNYLRDRRRLTLSEGPEVHVHVQDAFLDSNDKRLKGIGENLTRLRTYRNRADYQDTFFRINDASLLCIGLADDVLSELRGL